MQKKPYLTIKFEYNKRYMGKDAYYPSYPFTLDGPIFHNSIVEDALTNANLRTSMIVIDPDKEEGKNQSTFAFLYQNPTSVEKVGITNKLKAYKKGGILSIEGNQISKAAIYNTNGQIIAKVDSQADRIDIPTEAIGHGIFIVVAQNSKGQKLSVKIVL